MTLLDEMVSCSEAPWTIGPCDAQYQSLRETWNASISGIVLVPQLRSAVSMMVGGWYTLGSDVQLLGFRYDTHFVNQFQTKGNEDDGSHECHPKDPFENAEGYREFKTLCWIERDRSRK
jgi:hypothetical protein